MNTEELKRLAEAATPGPWIAEIEPTGLVGVNVRFDIRGAGYLAIAGGQSQEHLGDVGIHEDECKANAQLIACANPAAILALIAERDALLEALKGYVTAIATAGGGDKALFMAAIREADNEARAAITKAEGK